MNETELLSGNEAIARGAWEAGVHIGLAYPGTPSTECIETFAKEEGVYAEICPNEKVALEVGIGASMAGARVLVTMKHVGVNVAADPLFTAAYTGVGGGLVLLAADDPGMHSSQNEQDSRFYGLAARIPVLEPSDSTEALSFTKKAYDLSERFDVPIIIRSTTRISHAKTPVETGSRQIRPAIPYEKNLTKWVMMPVWAKQRRVVQDERVALLKEWVNESPLNRMDLGERRRGIVCSGAAYEYVVEALPGASVLKLGVTWPLPEKLLKDFAEEVEELFVVEEASDYLSTQVKSLGIRVSSFPHPLAGDGEISPQAIRKAFGEKCAKAAAPEADLPGRPPALCAGCPHRLVFKELSRIKAVVTGDIGCYTLGASPPLSAIDSCVDMGASISMAHGIELVRSLSDDVESRALSDRDEGSAEGSAESVDSSLGDSSAGKRPVVAVIGDSTFAHSGISSLVNTVYNRGGGCVAILDNRTTAMTGRQGNPFNGVTLQNRPSTELDIETLVRALGVEDLATVNPHDAKAVRAAFKRAGGNEGLSVLIFKAPCVLLERVRKAPFSVSDCKSCAVCTTLGCPAISLDAENGQAHIERETCIGCGQCAQYCAFGSILQETEQEGGR